MKLVDAGGQCFARIASTARVVTLCISVVSLLQGAAGASLRHGYRTDAASLPGVNATAELEGAVSALLSGRSLQGEFSRLPKTGLEEAETRGCPLAASELGLEGAGYDLPGIAAQWAIRSGGAGTSGSNPDEATIKKAVASLNEVMGKVWQSLDERVISCQAIKEKNSQWRDQLELDLVSASDQLATITGKRAEAVAGMQADEVALMQLNASWQEEVRAYKKTEERIAQARELQKNDNSKLQEFAATTQCSSSASFLAGGKNVAASEGLWLCESNVSNGITVQAAAAKASPVAFQSSEARKMLRSLLDASQRSSKDIPPHELQHLKCAFGRIGCAPLHLAVVRLSAETADTLDDLDEQEKQAKMGQQKSREKLIAQQEELRAHKMSLQQQLVDAVTMMGSVNALRRSLSADVRTHLRESRSHQAQCKTVVRKSFETMCGLRKVRSYLTSKSDQITINDVVDCDVTDWLPGECSAQCDDACPGTAEKPCGGESRLTREVIQAAGTHGMACPALERKEPCNQVKCPIDCTVSAWSSWSSCSRECGGGSRSRTRTIEQIPQHGGQACGPPTDSQPCNTGACGFCDLKNWSSWSTCSAVCGGGVQVRTRDPLHPEAEAPPEQDAEPRNSVSGLDAKVSERHANCENCAQNAAASFMESSKKKCPAASSSHRYAERACGEHTCQGDERCELEQDVILAIDGSAALSQSGFEVLRDFVVGLIEKYAGPSRIGIVQFGNGDLRQDGTITAGVLAADLSSDLGNVKAVVQNMGLLGGLPNTAEALALAGSMFRDDARQSSQKTLLVFTNSKPLYKHKAFEEAAKLRRQGVRIFVVAASDSLEDGPLWDKADDPTMVKEIASRPVEANFYHIDALQGPQADPLSHVATVFGRACRSVDSS